MFVSFRRPARSMLGLALVLSALAHPPGNAQEGQAATPAASDRKPAVTLPGTRSLTLHNAAGRAYRIMVTEPREAPGRQGHPVLYVLDGNSVFGAFSDAVRLQKQDFGKAIVVGIGYETDLPFDFHGRSYDYSPPLAPGQTRAPGAARLGGHDEFLDFLEQVVKPEIARRYPVDPVQQSLYGHSFGGMFALHALFTRPQLFTHYVAASPSLWWQDRYLLAEERGFAAKAAAQSVDLTHTTLLLIAGGRETPHTTKAAQALHARLQALSSHGLLTSYEQLDEENHMSVPVASVTKVLRQVFTARTR